MNGPQKPAVTVIIPTYNWSAVLPFSIASVLDQTFTDFELLVIGDRCTDDSADVVACVGDGRVQWHNLPTRTRHQGGPNNAGIELAKADVIAYLGHDDLWLPHHLETLIAPIHGGAAMAHGRTLTVVPGKAPEVFPFRWWPYQPGAWIPPTAMVHERELVLRAGGWRPPTGARTPDPEAELWSRMARIAGPPKLVSNLTNVKLPAVVRQDVYKLRPSDEQAYWLQRIRDADDPERALLAAAKADGTARTLARATRGRVRLRTRLGLRRSYPTRTAVERATRRLHYKGVED